MFDIPELAMPDLSKIPTLKEQLKPVIAAVLAGAMLQKADVPKGEEQKYLWDAFQGFQRIL